MSSALDDNGFEHLRDNPEIVVAHSLLTHIASEVGSVAFDMDRPAIVGINGPDGAGKSVLSRQLAEKMTVEGLPTTLVHVDNFTNPSSVRHAGADVIDNYYNRTFDFHSLVTGLLAPARAGETGNVAFLHPSPDEDGTMIPHEYEIGGAPSVVLVDGVFLFKPELADLFDYKVFLAISADTMLERARVRDVPKFGDAVLDKFAGKYIPAQQHYYAEAEPWKSADLVVECTDWSRPAIITGLGGGSAS